MSDFKPGDVVGLQDPFFGNLRRYKVTLVKQTPSGVWEVSHPDMGNSHYGEGWFVDENHPPITKLQGLDNYIQSLYLRNRTNDSPEVIDAWRTFDRMIEEEK